MGEQMGPRACLDIFGRDKSSLPDPVTVTMRPKIKAFFTY